MPATSPTTASAKHTMLARRTRWRRGAHGSATAEGTRSSGDSEARLQESEVTGGLVSISDNRFAILCSKEPAPGVQAGRETRLPLDPSSHHERPTSLPLHNDILSTNQPSSSEQIGDKELVPISSAKPCSNRPSILRLARPSPTNSTPMILDLQPVARTVASISATKPQAQLSPPALQNAALSAQSQNPCSTSIRASPDFATAAPHLSLLAPEPAPTLRSPPIPPDPMAIPSLGSLPIHPSLDIKYITSPKSSAPKAPQLATPTPTSVDFFHNDDPMHHIVRTTSGKILHIAAEIAAANGKSSMRPVGNVLVPGPAKKFGEVKGKMDRRNSECRRGDFASSPKGTKDESDEEGEEDWLGTEEGFWKQPFENAVKTRRQTSRKGSP